LQKINREEEKRQGTTSVVPEEQQKQLAFTDCGKTILGQCFVTGHGFSRAVRCTNKRDGLQPLLNFLSSKGPLARFSAACLSVPYEPHRINRGFTGC
jgi:hypothetical protein